MIAANFSGATFKEAALERTHVLAKQFATKHLTLPLLQLADGVYLSQSVAIARFLAP